MSFSLTPKPFLKKCHIEKSIAFSIPKPTFLLGYQKQFCLDTKSKFAWIPKASIHMTTRPTAKNSHIEEALLLRFKNSPVNDAYNQAK
jgi:hypothetical protein